MIGTMLDKFSYINKTLDLVKIQRLTLMTLLALCSHLLSGLASAKGVAHYYRYYDQRGTAVVSQSVSDQHIKKGYDVLDQQMMLIKKVPAYNLEHDLKQQQVRAKQARQINTQKKLTRAYRDVNYTQGKKQRRLSKLYLQLAEQYRRLNVLQKENARLLHLRASYYRRGTKPPKELLQQYNLNQVATQEAYQSLSRVQQKLKQQAAFYDDIINRLK